MLKAVFAVLVVLLGAGVIWLFEDDMPAAEVDALYADDRSEFLITDTGARIHFRDEGPDGLAVVLVHGANASLHTWEPWVALLSDSYRLVTLDLPGHGLTGRVPGDDYTQPAMAAAVSAVADHLGLTRFVLGGNSMGGGVTWRYTLAQPDRVLAMVLVDASGPAAWRRQRAETGTGDTPLAFELLTYPWFRAVARYLDPYYLVAQGLRASYADDSLVDESLIRRYRDLTLREGSRQAILSRFGGRADAPPVDPAVLSSLTQPTLILWGAEDSLIGVDVAQRFDEVLPNTRLIVYDDLGHVPMEEAPERTAADVRGFLETLQPTN